MRHISELYSIHGGKLKKHIMIHPEDSESDEEDGMGLYAGGGGSGLYASGGSVKSDFKKLGKYITSKKGGLASLLVNKGIPTATGALAGAAAEAAFPEAGPLAGFVGNQAGQMGGRELAKFISKKAGTGLNLKRGRPKKSQSAGDLIHIDLGSHNGEMGGGKLKSDLVKTYNKVVPKKLQPAVNNLAGQVGNYALDKAGYGEPIPVKGGKLKQDLIKTYNKIVPKKLQPAVNELAGQVANYGLDKAGYGEPIPTGKGIRKGRMVKGSPEAKAWAEKMRQSRMK